jgi:hypothetical protein
MKLGNREISEVSIVGLVLIVQGAGSGLAKAIGDTNWGLLAVAERWTVVPAWVGFALAAIGLVVVIWGARSKPANS